MAGYPGGSRLVGAGVFGGRQDTVALEELHQDDKASMVRPQRVAARDLPFTDNHGIFNMFGRPRTPQKKGLLRHELNTAMNERLNDHHAQAQRGAQQMARRGLQLSIEVLAEEGLIVVHSEISSGVSGARGMVTKVETGVMGEICSILWEDGRKGCYSSLLLRTADHKRRHGPREEVPPPATRPGPAPYCMGGKTWERPRGLVAPPQQPPPLGHSTACNPGAFRVYQYQPEVHKRNQPNIHDDLQQRRWVFACVCVCKFMCVCMCMCVYVCTHTICVPRICTF